MQKFPAFIRPSVPQAPFLLLLHTRTSPRSTKYRPLLRPTKRMEPTEIETELDQFPPQALPREPGSPSPTAENQSPGKKVSTSRPLPPSALKGAKKERKKKVTWHPDVIDNDEKRILKPLRKPIILSWTEEPTREDDLNAPSSGER